MIEKDKFKLIKYNRMSFGAVTISMYQKIPLLWYGYNYFNIYQNEVINDRKIN